MRWSLTLRDQTIELIRLFLAQLHHQAPPDAAGYVPIGSDSSWSSRWTSPRLAPPLRRRSAALPRV
uniref:Uncharacterized protein n=1 Tax=Hyaloperonospora arabidopsidis (strain Emoy2) TaxID=559515 RepID=M4B9P9_HYAAE